MTKSNNLPILMEFINRQVREFPCDLTHNDAKIVTLFDISWKDVTQLSKIFEQARLSTSQ